MNYFRKKNYGNYNKTISIIIRYKSRVGFSCRNLRLEKCGFSLEYQGAGKYQGKQTQIKKYVYGDD